MFVKPFSPRPDPSGNEVQLELILINSSLTLSPVRLIRNHSMGLVHVFHRRGELPLDLGTDAWASRRRPGRPNDPHIVAETFHEHNW